MEKLSQADSHAAAPNDNWSLLSDARQDLAFQARYASGCLGDFTQRQQALAKQHTPMSDKELLVWEQDFTDARAKITQAEQRIPDFSNADLTETEAHIYRGCQPAETIDARLGRFYHTRARSLNQAIATSAEPHSPDSDVTREFFHAVMDHVINYRYPADGLKGMSGMEYENFLRRRRLSHDHVIKTLNHLNELATKYGTPAFTPSHYQTSNLYSLAKHDPYAESCADMHRDIVEAYYSEAFSSDIAKVERESRYDF